MQLIQLSPRKALNKAHLLNIAFLSCLLSANAQFDKVKNDGLSSHVMSTITVGSRVQHPQPGPRENSDEAVKIGARRVLQSCSFKGC